MIKVLVFILAFQTPDGMIHIDNEIVTECPKNEAVQAYMMPRMEKKDILMWRGRCLEINVPTMEQGGA